MTVETLSAVSVLRRGRILPTMFHFIPLKRRLMCRRELLLLGAGAANSTSSFGHKNN